MATHDHRVAHGRPVAHHHHPHPPAAAERVPDPSFDGSVLADIGADVGALVVYTGPALEGREIEIERIDGRRRPTHVAIRERRLSHGSMWAAFFPALAAGNYSLQLIGEHHARPVTIAGGSVTEVHW